MRQTAFAANKHREDLVEITMLVKFLIYQANKVDADVEFEQSHAIALFDLPATETDGLTTPELMANVAEHYAQVATSASDPA